MNEYSYDDVNFIGGTERVANALGKECYYGFSAKQVLENAQNDKSSSILKWVDNDNYKPFGDTQGGWYPFMIVKKEPESKYVPFKSKEEFVERYTEVKEEAELGSFNNKLFQCGMWLKEKGHNSETYCMVTEIWESGVVVGNNAIATGENTVIKDFTLWENLYLGYTFPDGSPCGKEKK